MPQGTGYWISPYGEFIEIDEHLDYVRNNKEQFGLSADDFVFTDEERAKGPMGPSALRERILGQVVRGGWIRLRRAPGMTPTFEVSRNNDKNLFLIAEAIMATGIASRGEPIRIVDHFSKVTIVLSVTPLLAGDLYRHNPDKLVVAELGFFSASDPDQLLDHITHKLRCQQVVITCNRHNSSVKIVKPEWMDNALFKTLCSQEAEALSVRFNTEVEVHV